MTECIGQSQGSYFKIKSAFLSSSLSPVQYPSLFPSQEWTNPNPLSFNTWLPVDKSLLTQILGKGSIRLQYVMKIDVSIVVGYILGINKLSKYLQFAIISTTEM